MRNIRKKFTDIKKPKLKKEEAKSEALKFFRDRYTAMNSARQPYFLNFEKDEKLFRSHIETSTKADWQSKNFIPRIFGIVMASLSEFAINKPDIIVEPDTRQDATKVPYMKAAMHANWQKNKGNAELLFGILDALKLGIGIFEIGYRKNERTIKEVKGDPMSTEMEWKEKTIYDFDDVYFETVNPRYFWLDESATTVSDATDCIRQYIYSEQAFHNIFDSKFPEAEKVQVKGEVIKEEFFKPFIGSGTGTNEICVFKYTNKIKDGTITWWIANGVLLNDPEDPIPYHHKQLPYAEIKLVPFDRYTFYGYSLPRLLEDLQHEMNTLRNMSIDQTHLNIFSPFFYSADEDLDENIFTIEPGVGIPVSDPSAFKFFKQGSVGEDAYRMMDKFDDDTRQATGFDSRMTGLPAGGTATETAILKETSLKRINLYLRFLEEFSMPDFAEIWKDTIQQFYFDSSDVKRRKTKKRGKEKTEIFRSIKIPKADVSSFRSVDTVGDFNFLYVKPEDIRGVFGTNVKIGTSISISKELDKQVKLQLYSIFGMEELVDRKKLVVDVLRAHNLDEEEYLVEKNKIDMNQSIALAEEQNKELIAGEIPKIIPELVTVEHIQLHDALLKSPGINDTIKKAVMKHILEEIRISKVSGVMGDMEGMPEEEAGAEPGMKFPGSERTPELSKPLAKQSGLTREAVLPPTASELGASAPNKDVIKPR